MPIERASLELLQKLRIQRGVAAAATVLWLCLAFPLLDKSYLETFRPLYSLAALLIGLILS
ncbi:MAG: hypothetical protein QHC67_18245 [Sphingobium sp.]|uniref:hypothetical protein n=1 Tax=Sphingobium sp. TaxID=1912891 RepID=UPI0029B7887D|nr:hypothetical protein [Sphingobium sp.]MDX3911717.1 hypothetical protein [Sphingobium sp.]